MKLTIQILIPLFSVGILFCSDSAKDKELFEQSKAIFKPIPDSIGQTASTEQIELGKKLYNEKKLSINDSQSCASCHILDNKKAGVDNEATSIGALGKKGGRNSPTTLNSGLQFAQFWDGRAKDLVEQAKGPILNPIEMGMKSPEEVVKKITAIPEYRDGFQKAFPDSKNPITYDNLAIAIASFENTLLTRDRFDDYLKGNLSSLTAKEKNGLRLFISTGCSSCHNGVLLGGNNYFKFGVVKPYKNKEDKGRSAVTKNSAEDYFFKVPTLRNVALTAPYFHDGSVSDIKEAVKLMAELQLGKQLNQSEVDSITDFLKSLSDKNRL